jgi:hypothetical protein
MRRFFERGRGVRLHHIAAPSPDHFDLQGLVYFSCFNTTLTINGAGTGF